MQNKLCKTRVVAVAAAAAVLIVRLSHRGRHASLVQTATPIIELKNVATFQVQTTIYGEIKWIRIVGMLQIK